MKRVVSMVLVLLLVAGWAGAETHNGRLQKLAEKTERSVDQISQMVSLFDHISLSYDEFSLDESLYISEYLVAISCSLASFLGTEDYYMALCITDLILYGGNSFTEYGFEIDANSIASISNRLGISKRFENLSGYEMFKVRVMLIGDLISHLQTRFAALEDTIRKQLP